MNIEVSSRIKHLARLLSLERPHLSAQEAASDSWDMICRCPTLIVHDAPSPKRMAIEAGLAAMGKESNMAMVSKRDKEEALVRGIRMGRVSPLILAARPGAALRGRKTLTRNEQTTTASRMFGYYDRGASTERWSKKGILAGLPSDLVSELISVRPDLMISVEARRSLDGMMNEVGELLGGLKRNSKASIQLLIHHPWLIDYEGLDLIVSPEVVLSVDQSLGGGHLGRLKSFELILLLMAQAQPALPADMSISPDLKIHLETLVASIKEEDTWASELGRCVDLYDQKSLVRILHLANSNSLMAMDRLATLKTLGLSSKISFLSAVTMNQADFDRLAVRSPSKIISAEPESNRRRGYIKRQ